MNYDERYQVRHPEIERELRTLATGIDEHLPDGWGFALLLFDFNTSEGAMFYISNADRADMITALREFLAMQEREASAK